MAVDAGVFAETAAGTAEEVGTASVSPTWLGVVVAASDKVGGLVTAPAPVPDPESDEPVCPGSARPETAGGAPAAPVWVGSPEAGGEAVPAQPAPTRNIETKAAMHADFRISSYRP